MADKDKYTKLLERLEREFTPGGSEFAHNEDALVRYIKERLNRAEDRARKKEGLVNTPRTEWRRFF